MVKVSVIIPLYNKEAYIKRALHSVLKQTIQDFEIIVVDDGSTDNGPDIVKMFKDSRLRLVQQENSGVSAARNKGIQKSKCDLIAFLDADDEWLPTFLETILRLKENNPEAGAYVTAYDRYQDDKITQIPYKGIPFAPWEGILPSYFLVASLTGMPVASSAICIPKHVFHDVGIFLEDVWMWEDSELWGRIALKYPIAFSWNVGAKYHIDSDNRACDKITPFVEHPFVKVACEKIKNNAVSHDILADVNEYIALLRIDFAVRNVCTGNRKAAIAILTTCNTKLFYKKKYIWMALAMVPDDLFSIIIMIKCHLIDLLFSASKIDK